MTPYDENILQEFADRLYMKATWVIVSSGFMGATIGAFLGYLPTIAWYYKSADFVQPPKDHTMCIFLAMTGLGLGLGRGFAKAFTYKLEAQRTLCMMRIERNSRAAAPPVTTA